MAFSLFDCLKAVGLEHYYESFTSIGVCQADHLRGISLDDCHLLGIHSVENRTRLFRLIQLVKDLDPNNANNDDKIYNEGGKTYFPVDDNSSNNYKSLNYQDKNGADASHFNAPSFTKPLNIRRRLDFSDELAVVPQQSLFAHHVDTFHIFSECSRKSQSHNRENKKQSIKRDNSSFNLNTKLPENSVTINNPNLNSATVRKRTFSDRPFKYTETKFPRPKRCTTDAAKPVPVYEAKRTNGYNYGLPLSLNHTPKNKNKKMGGQRITVCVRKKPLTHAEGRRGEKDVVTTPGGECVVVHESKEAVDLTQYELQHKFYFDQVFGEESTNEDVYQKATFPLVQHMLRGGKATCFAYGQTGAGKTHTMLGSPGKPGLYTLAVRDIFAHLFTTNKFSSLLVYVSFFEIYCGQLYDLLDHRKRLFAREDGKNVVHISRLRDVRVDSVNSLLEVISQGTAERTHGVSGANPLSSRSHALLQIQLRHPNQQITGRMWFVDLAGSERASDANKTNRQSRIEGAEINQSLLALKECIRSLDREESHTPFRQSKLTLVLKDSFIGDSMTCMIANISPGHKAAEHTLNTLRYADRVKELRGEGGLKRKGGNKMMLSPKNYLSNSCCFSDGTPKKTEPRKQSSYFGFNTPATIHPGGGFFCSTPEKDICEEEMQAVVRKEFGLEQMTPVRGWLSLDEKSPRSTGESKADSRRVKHNHNESNYIHCVGGRSSRSMIEQENTTLQKQDKASKACLAVPERGFGFFHITKESMHHSLKNTKRLETECSESKRQVENNRNMSGFQCKVDEIERKRHLRRYHQQLQRFIPTSASSSVHFPLSSTYPPSIKHFSHLSISGQFSSPASFEDASGTDVSLHSNQIPSYRGEILMQTEASPNYCASEGEIYSRNKDEDSRVSLQELERSFRQDCCENKKKMSNKQEVKKSDGGAAVMVRKCAWVASTETKPADRRMSSASSGARLSHNCSSDHRKEEGLDPSDAPHNEVWRVKQKKAANSLESTFIDDDPFTEFLFESQHQRAPAERPFSPTFEETPTTRSDREASVKTNHLMLSKNIHTLLLPNASKVMSQQKKTPSPDTNPSTSLPATINISTTGCLSPPSLNRTSESLRQYKYPEIISKKYEENETQTNSFSYPTNQFSFSQTQVDRQAVRALFPQENESKILVTPSKGEGGHRNSQTRSEDYLHGKMEEEIFEDEDAELGFSFLKLPQKQVFRHAAPKSIKIDPQNNNVHMTGTSKPPSAGFILVQKEENCQENQRESTPHKKPNVPLAFSAPYTSPHTHLVSSFIQEHSNTGSPTDENPPECPPSATTQQSKSSSTRLDISNQFGDSNISTNPNNPTVLNWRDRFRNQQIRPTPHLRNMNELSNAKLCILKAHLDQLKEMEALIQKEKMLLSQQHDMVLWEYANKLSEIMDRKARCAESIKSQLQNYLKPIPSMTFHNQTD